jgi:hypothetical protein
VDVIIQEGGCLSSVPLLVIAAARPQVHQWASLPRLAAVEAGVRWRQKQAVTDWKSRSRASF